MAGVYGKHLGLLLFERCCSGPKIFGCTKFVQSKFHSVETVENIESEFGGASRDRTDDLIVANDALSQL
ncbi:MAG TPA: hypothetical protein VFF39_06600, partial [Verrucomicrobiae bacterium]|nr:hypothetical protein [Verrucomicrobiae bacterium]